MSHAARHRSRLMSQVTRPRPWRRPRAPSPQSSSAALPAQPRRSRRHQHDHGNQYSCARGSRLRRRSRCSPWRARFSFQSRGVLAKDTSSARVCVMHWRTCSFAPKHATTASPSSLQRRTRVTASPRRRSGRSVLDAITSCALEERCPDNLTLRQIFAFADDATYGGTVPDAGSLHEWQRRVRDTLDHLEDEAS